MNSKLLFFDIETVSKSENLEIGSQEYLTFQWKNRDKTTGELLDDEELLALYKKNAALSPTFTKIVCISVGYIKDGVFYVGSITGDQKSIIKKFYSILENGYIPCGYNVLRFDLPVVRIKAIEEGLIGLLPQHVSDVNRKPWELAESVVDIMDILKGTYYYSLSLDEACLLCGVDSPKDDIKGHEVSKYFYEVEDGISKIAEYCNKDVVSSARVYCVLNNIEFPKEVVVKNIEAQPTKSYTKMANTKSVSGNIAKQLQEELADNLTKEQLEVGLEILSEASFDTSMETQDNKSQKQEKVERVQALLESKT